MLCVKALISNELKYVVPKLRDLKLTLRKLRGENVRERIKEEQFDLKIATKLVDELVVMIAEHEAMEEEQFQASVNTLRRLVRASTDLQNDKHPATELVYYSSIYLRAPHALDNKLPFFDKHMKELITQMEDTMKNLLETPNHPHNRKRSLEKQDDVDKVVMVLENMKAKYSKLNRTLRMVRCYMSNLLVDHNLLAEKLYEARHYVCAMTEIYLMEEREDDNFLIQDIFAKQTADIPYIMRLSDWDVMKRKRRPHPLESKREGIKLSQKIEALMDHMKMIIDLLTWFKDFRVSESLRVVRKVDLHLHELKKEIHDCLKMSEKSPYTDDIF